MLHEVQIRFPYAHSLNVKEIYRRNKKRRGCSRYLLAVSVDIEKDGETMPAKLAIVFSRYMMLSVAQRENEGDRTICELCFCLLDEMEEFTSSFVHRLPQYMQEALERRESVA